MNIQFLNKEVECSSTVYVDLERKLYFIFRNNLQLFSRLSDAFNEAEVSRSFRNAYMVYEKNLVEKISEKIKAGKYLKYDNGRD